LFEEVRKKVGAKNEKKQKKMSKIENPKKVLKKTLFFEVCDEYAHKMSF
jgi:hypothetical protein